MRESREDSIRSIFKRDHVVTVEDLCLEIGIKEPMIRRYIGTIEAISSVNCNSKYYLLPDSNTFKGSKLIEIDGKVFYKGRTLQSALYYIVDQSPCGLKIGEIKERLKTSVSALLPKMHSGGQVARRKISGVRGYVYLSLDAAKRKKQIASRKDSLNQINDSTDLSEEFDTDLVIDTLVTMIKKPDLAAKSVALSLQRRGKKISSDKVREIVQHFDIRKKNF